MRHMNLPARAWCNQLTNLRNFCSASRIFSAGGEYSFVVSTEAASNLKSLRLDTFLASQLPQLSRARLQASIKQGFIAINGQSKLKASHQVRLGDTIECSIVPVAPLEASPEDIPLNIVYEDDEVLVINKEADMVVHPAPGNYSGTLVNAILHHCDLPSTKIDPEEETENLDEVFSDGKSKELVQNTSNSIVIRPGIVHRLDKGTTGLLVVAKTDSAQLSLSRQFKARTVKREYWSVSIGCPSPPMGKIESNIGRDLRDRKKMASFALASAVGRSAGSNYKVLKPLADGCAALLAWRLETGRTHQIRVHAKQLNTPLFGDEVYGGGAAVVANQLGRGKSARAAASRRLAKDLGRPALHAKTLGFRHPRSGQLLEFTSELPEDMAYVVEMLQTL